MFDCSSDILSDPVIDRSVLSKHVFECSFPEIAGLVNQTLPLVKINELTLIGFPLSYEYANSSLLKEVRLAYEFARNTFTDLDKNQLKFAYQEAMLLASSPIFDSELVPDVSVDPYGEFTLSHKSKAGYIDIGVCGKAELSYHIRNDIEPDKTHFEDYDWKDYRIPNEFVSALNALKQHL